MADIVPTARQVEYQDWEMGLFCHFGIRTFYEGHRDWDGRAMPPEGFAPTEFDPGQWAATAREAGMNYVVLTAKHHDGFANWPSAHSDYSVAAAPWKGGRGDVIAEYTEACRAHGLACGLYYSPAEASDRFKKGAADNYDEHFLAQVSELLDGRCGPIDILWFDGCGSEDHPYDWPRIIAEIRRMQPNVLIFNMGDPDFRWIGNECGLAPSPVWNVVDRVPFSVLTGAGETLQGARAKWLPAECDCRIRQANWFYSDADEHTVKGLEELLGLYYLSVGRGCNLLINVGPDRRGLLPDTDARRLRDLGAEIRRRFASPIATLADFARSDDGPCWEYQVDKPVLIDHVVIQEAISRGEHVRRFAVYADPTGGSAPIRVHEGYNVGHKAICRFPLVQARKVRLEIIARDGPVELRSLELHNACGPRTQRAAPPPAAPGSRHETSMNEPEHPPLLCHRCGAALTPGEGNFYVVRIEAFADPTPPRLSEGDFEIDINAEIEKLLEEMKHMTPQELMDQVHRRLTIHLCGACYRLWIEDPAQ